MDWCKILENLQFVSFPTPVLEWHETLQTRILARPGCLCIVCIPWSRDSSPGSLLPVPMGQHFRKQSGGNLAGDLSHPPLWCLSPTQPCGRGAECCAETSPGYPELRRSPGPTCLCIAQDAQLEAATREQEAQAVPETLPLSIHILPRTSSPIAQHPNSRCYCSAPV